MPMMHLGFVVGVTLLAAVQEPATVQPVVESATTTGLVPPGKDPFSNIAFITLPAQRNMRSPQERDSIGRQSDDGRPRIVCGMTVVPVTPDSDPKMLLSPKPDSKVEYKMRTVSPRVCRE
jgi:hypothetical protein